jgi:dethiobiotin synthetase
LNGGLFVTGTDTGVGKTVVTAALLRRAAALGLRACGMKPVAAGTRLSGGTNVNDDVETLARAGNVAAPAELLCPVLLREPASPHIAARLEGRTIDLDHLVRCYGELRARADRIIVEGAGGWYAPLDDTFTIAGLASRLGLPVILVAAVRLGWLNHTALTARAIAADGCRLAGWVANMVEPPLAHLEANLAYLKGHIPAPLLGVVPQLPGDSTALACDWLRDADPVLKEGW